MANLSNINNKFLVTTGGDVGVGVTSPGSKLSIGGTTGSYNSGIGFQPTGTGARIYRTFIATDGSFRFDDVTAGFLTRLTIQAGGNVGIGNTNPLAKLQITSGDSGASSPWSNADELVLESSGNAGLAFQTPNTGAATIAFQDPESVQAGFIQYLHADNALRFATNGNNERMRITSGGNVGINETNPDERLSVIGGNILVKSSNSGGGDANNNLILFDTDTTGSSGQGIGSVQFYGSDTSGAGAGIKCQVKAFYANDGDSSIMTFSTSDSTTNNQERMRITSDGQVNITKGSSGTVLYLDGTNAYDAETGIQLSVGRAKISGFLNTTGGTPGSSLRFYTMPDNGSVTERMRIDSSGNVGIGETDPLGYWGQANNIVIDTSGNGGITIKSTNAGNGRLVFTDTKSTTAGNTDGGMITYSHNDDEMRFQTNGSQKMVVDSSGNVGIGTTSPSAKLEVRGTAPTYTNSSTVFWGGTTNNDSHNGIMLSSYGDALGGSLASNLLYSNSGTPTQTNTNRSSGQITFGNTTVAAKTSDISFGGYYKGTTSFVERMRISSGGDVLFGTTSTPNGTSVYGSAFTDETSNRMILRMASATTGAVNLVQFYNGNGLVGKIQTSGSATSYITSSDYRLKEDLQDFNGLDKVSKIPVYDFKWKTDESRSYGVIAHKLQEVLPQAVSGEKDAEEMQGVDYSKIVPLLVKSIQELKAEIDELKK